MYKICRVLESLAKLLVKKTRIVNKLSKFIILIYLQKIRTLSSGILCSVALLSTEISEELISSVIIVTRIGELRILAVTSNIASRVHGNIYYIYWYKIYIRLNIWSENKLYIMFSNDLNKIQFILNNFWNLNNNHKKNISLYIIH